MELPASIYEDGDEGHAISRFVSNAQTYTQDRMLELIAIFFAGRAG